MVLASEVATGQATGKVATTVVAIILVATMVVVTTQVVTMEEAEDDTEEEIMGEIATIRIGESLQGEMMAGATSARSLATTLGNVRSKEVVQVFEEL